MCDQGRLFLCFPVARPNGIRPRFPPARGKGTIPDRLKPKKVGSKSARRERVYKRAAETRRDFFRRGGTTERAFAARNAAASDAQSVTTSGVRDRKQTEDYKTCVRRTDIAWVEIFLRHKIDSLILCFFVARPHGIRPCFSPRNARCAFPTSGKDNAQHPTA